MKIGILTYETYESNVITHRVLSAFPGQVVGIMRSSVLIAGMSQRRGAWFLMTRVAPGFAIAKAAQNMFYKVARRLLGPLGLGPRVPTLAQMARHHAVPMIASSNVNSADSLERLRNWRPDLLLSIYFNQRLGAAAISVPPRGVINVHPSLLPRNRGLFPYFWALANGDKESGVTVHFIDGAFDTGDIILQERVPILPGESIASLAHKSARLGVELLTRAVRQLEAGTQTRTPQSGNGATYNSWPGRADVQRLRASGYRYGTIFGAAE